MSSASAVVVDAGRLSRDINAIASFSEADPSIGYSRPTFSPSWRNARDYVVREAEAAGCTTRISAAGNVHARSRDLGWDRKAWLCGSHVDSVPTGGKFDGVTGVVAALELLRIAPQNPVELIVFAEEEGTTFGLGMLGSKAWAGTLGPAELERLTNVSGQTFLEAGAAHGVVPGRLAAERFSSQHYHGLVEVHVEQGASLWKAGEPLAVVTAINGRRQYLCSFEGAPNHAGSTSMEDRRDALAGAAEGIRYLESLARDLDVDARGSVITVGQLAVEPNAINVIPGRVRMSIDFRSPSAAVLDRGEERLLNRLRRFAAGRGLGISIDRTETLPAVPMDPAVCERLREGARRIGMRLPDATSGALHDTAILAPLLPSAMLFVASKDGISHNPAEESRVEDIARAVQLLAEALR